MIKFYPGHTIGYQTLYLNLADEGLVMLTGEIYHFNENRTNKVVPVHHNYDVEQTRKSMQQFEEFIKKNGVRVIIQHEMENFKKLPTPPKYLD